MPEKQYIICMRMRAPTLALLSAVTYSAALPNEFLPYGSPVIGIVSLIPLYAAFLFAADMRSAIRAGAVFGAISTMLSNYWLANFGEFSAWTLGGPTVGYIGYNALLAAVLYTILRLPRHIRPLAFTAAWTGYELLKSIGYLGYPWGLAAYSFGDVLPAMQIADVTGVYGLTFLVVYANAALAELWVGDLREKPLLSGRTVGAAWHFEPQERSIAATGTLPRRATRLLRTHATAPAVAHLVVAAGLFVVAFAYGRQRLNESREPTDTLRALLVQQNTDSWAPGNLGHTVQQLQSLSLDGLERNEHDLLVWSENSLSLPYAEYQEGYYSRTPANYPLTDFIADLEIPLMTGSPYVIDRESGEAWNAALLIEPGTGEILQRYGKQQLVPFAEHIPFWELPFVRRFFREVVGLQAVWAMGSEQTVFELPARNGTVAGAAPICFEDAFAPIVREMTHAGADVFVNLTNNAWSETNSAQYQHFVAARFRGIEARRALIRSTNSGLTGVVDRTGAQTASLPMFEAASLSVEVPIYADEPLTVYHRIGDLFAWIMIVATAAAVAAVAYRDSRRINS